MLGQPSFTDQLILQRKQIILANPELKNNPRIISGYDAQIRLFAINEMERLNRIYIWNGRKKANKIRKALESIDNHLKANEEDIKPTYKDLSNQFGLFKALSFQRFGCTGFIYGKDKITTAMNRFNTKFAEIVA